MRPAFVCLVLDLVAQIGNEVLDVHRELESWRKDPLDGNQRGDLSMKLQRALEKQKTWIRALETEFEEDE